MKNLLKLILILFIAIFIQSNTYAANYKLLVLPDNIQFDTTNYLVYPDTSILFASDFINEIKKDGRISIVSTTQIRDALRKDKKIAQLTEKALREYKYNYNISFVDLRAIARYFNTNLVLLVTSQTDTQNYLMRRSVWGAINIPGTTPIDPIYKLSTYVSLVDVNQEFVIWDKTYYKKIASMEYRIIPNNFAPATEQLHKIKAYSKNDLAPLVASIVEAKILPEMRPVDGMMKNFNTVKSIRANVLPSPVNYVSPKTNIKEAAKQYVIIPEKYNAFTQEKVKKRKIKRQERAAKRIAKKQAKLANKTAEKNKLRKKFDFKKSKLYKFFVLPDDVVEDTIMVPDAQDLDFNTSGKQMNKPATLNRRKYDDYGVMMNAL